MLTFSLTIVRHGETQYNRDKLLQGQGVDTALSETGLLQGEAVGRYLKDIPFSKVFASNLQRAIQTAEIILRNNNRCSGLKMIVEPLLRERGFGVAEGRPKEDLKNMAMAEGKSCRRYTPPGGETLDQVKLRFISFLKLLFKSVLEEFNSNGTKSSSLNEDPPPPGGSAWDGLHGVPVHVLVVSHGSYMRVATKHLVEDLDCILPEGVRMSQLFSPCPNTGISRFIFVLSQSGSEPELSDVRCLFTNRSEHLHNEEAKK